MLYFKCPTCKTVLSNKQLPFEEGLDKICKDTKLSEDEAKKKKMELLDKLLVKRQCCRIRIMTYVKQVELIK